MCVCVCVNMPEALATHCYCLNACQATVCLPKTGSAQIARTLSSEGRCKILKPIPCNSWLCPVTPEPHSRSKEVRTAVGFLCVRNCISQGRKDTELTGDYSLGVYVLSVCLSPHSFILSVLFVHLDVLIFKRKDLC